MRYLVLGPAAMGIFTLIGSLKKIEDKIVQKEVSKIEHEDELGEVWTRMNSKTQENNLKETTSTVPLVEEKEKEVVFVEDVVVEDVVVEEDVLVEEVDYFNTLDLDSHIFDNDD